MAKNLTAFFLLLAASLPLAAQCESTPAVQQILAKAAQLSYENLPYKEVRTRQAALFRQELENHPHDYFLLRRLLQTYESRDESIAWAKSLRDKFPTQPVYELIYAQATVGRDTPGAIRAMEALTKSHPELTRATLALAETSTYGKFKDNARVKAGLDAFLKACPAPLDSSVIRLMAQAGSREQMAALAQNVRKRLDAEPVSLMSSVWETLWALEFKAQLPSTHDALRKQVARDLERMEEAPERGELRWLQFLSSGYQSAGNMEASKRIDDEILVKYPASDVAKRTLRDRFSKERPYPKPGEAAQLETWSRAAAATYAEWRKRWPEDSLLYNDLFLALSRLPDTPPQEVARMGDELVALYHKNINWWGSPPLEFRVADAFLKAKVNLDKIPGLVGEAVKADEKRRAEQDQDDRQPDELRTMMAESNESQRLERARILLEYCLATKQTGPAREIEAELAALKPSKPYAKASLLQRQAQAAEVFGRKLDALMLYRTALDTRPSAPTTLDGKDALKDNIDRLWKELGGTPATLAQFLNKPKATEATDSRWERPKNPIPAFSVPDLEGKTWKLAALEGKAVLINLWATWCGPCRAEHPEFQKLYDKLKTRSDVSVISFNVDDNIGQVAPYMQENKYTFPVLLAREVVDAVLPVIAIPQNWFVDAKGKWQWTELGYGGEPKWQELMLAKLDEVLKGQ